MKNVLFIVLICISSTCLGQDSLFVNFRHINAAITPKALSDIRTFFKGRKAERILLTAKFSSEGNASQNRLLADMRLFVVRSVIQKRGIPFNIISSKLELSDDGSKNGDVEIVTFFANAKGARVLKKSNIVQISEVDFFNPTKTETVVKKEFANKEPTEVTEKEIVLDEAAFKMNATVSLPNLIFQGSSHYFLSSSERVLRALLKVMKSRTDIEIELQGHVCCNPPGVDALDIVTGRNDLSVMRARAVYEYLISGGIAAERMTYRGFGSSNRLYPDELNDTEKMLNRRVEVLITASD